MIDSYTKLFGIIGNPVRHSISPIMHNQAFASLGLNAVYVAFEVKQVKEAIEGIKALGILGVSVTIPHKESVIPYLDSIDSTAQKIGAVNTIVNEHDKLKGYNSDGIGAYNSITETGFDLNGKSILLIGNGGTAKAIAYTILDKSKPENLVILGRNQMRVNSFTYRLREIFHFQKITPIYSSHDPQLAEAISNAHIIINSSPVGMSPNDKNSPIPTDNIIKEHVVFDVVYKPFQTKLLTESKKRGATCINGIKMLVNQGIVQFELWTKQQAPKDLICSVIEKAIVTPIP